LLIGGTPTTYYGEEIGMVDLPVDQLAFEDSQDEAGIKFGVCFQYFFYIFFGLNYFISFFLSLNYFQTLVAIMNVLQCNGIQMSRHLVDLWSRISLLNDRGYQFIQILRY
jgi:hypothetical protein